MCAAVPPDGKPLGRQWVRVWLGRPGAVLGMRMMPHGLGPGRCKPHTGRVAGALTSANGPIIALILLGGCQAAVGPAVAVGAVEASSVAVFGRGTVDLAYSALSGRDCSIVRLDEGKSWCKPKEALPAAPRFCTRTLGTPECFDDPAQLPDHPAQLADGPSTLTPEQEKNRNRGITW